MEPSGMRILVVLAAGLCFLAASQSSKAEALEEITKQVKLGDPVSFDLKGNAEDASQSYPCQWGVPNTLDQQFDEIQYKTADPAEEKGFKGRLDEWKYTKTGGSNRLDCGIRIKSTVIEDQGLWSGQFDVEDKKFFRLNVLAPPNNLTAAPENRYTYSLQQDQPNDSDELVFYALGSTQALDCKVYIGSNEVVQLENYPVFENDTEDPRPSEEYEVYTKTIITLNVTAEDDGKVLAYECPDPTSTTDPLRLELNLTVTAPPAAHDYESNGFSGGKIGSSVTLELKFHSNPQPDSIFWFMHDIDGAIEIENVTYALTRIDEDPSNIVNITENSRYQLGDFISDGDNKFRTQLIVTELLEDDEGKNNYIQVRNSNGVTNYTIAFNEFESGGLSDGAIAGIVIGVLLAVVVLAAVSFLLVKKMKGKKKKQVSRPQSNPVPAERAQRSDNVSGSGGTSTNSGSHGGEDNSGMELE